MHNLQWKKERKQSNTQGDLPFAQSSIINCIVSGDGGGGKLLTTLLNSVPRFQSSINVEFHIKFPRKESENLFGENYNYKPSNKTELNNDTDNLLKLESKAKKQIKNTKTLIPSYRLNNTKLQINNSGSKLKYFPNK